MSNFCWAFILFLGLLGFLLVGTSSYLGRKRRGASGSVGA